MALFHVNLVEGGYMLYLQRAVFSRFFPPPPR